MSRLALTPSISSPSLPLITRLHFRHSVSPPHELRFLVTIAVENFRPEGTILYQVSSLHKRAAVVTSIGVGSHLTDPVQQRKCEPEGLKETAMMG